ncbi:MAG TPA: serine/threonine-protein kinase [Nocardioides sp.]|nr:serine/threonine-protein kinase [Nocardioides sp.]
MPVTTHAGYPEPGELIGTYRVGQRLGMGGMGIVFEALDTQLNRQVALKIISPHLADDQAFRARFTREAQAQASLDSPHVVHVYAHGEVDGRLYIATQLVPDGDLGQMIQRRGAPALGIAVDLIAQIASGLADAHAAGLVHRDIKPANVLLRIGTDSVRAYLADFGIARQVNVDSNLTTAGVTVGTPTYMAPELHTGGQSGPASDVYSLGCLLWAAVSGHAPYTGTSDYEIVNAHFSSPIPQLPETSQMAAAVNRVLRISMAKQPGDRYRDAGGMRDDLYAALRMPEGAAATVSGPMGFAGAAPSSGGRRTGPIVALVAVVVLAVAGAGVAYAVTRDDDGTPSADPSSESSTSESPTESPTETDTGSPTTEPPVTEEYTPQPGDDDKAVVVLTDALQGQEGVDPGTAGCVAEKLVEELGVERMVEAGMLTADLEINNDPMSGGLPADVQTAVFSAAFDCALQ